MTNQFACHVSSWELEQWKDALDITSESGFAGIEGIEELYEEFPDKIELAQRLLTDRKLQLVALTGSGDFALSDNRPDILSDCLRRAEFLSRLKAPYLIVETGSRSIVEDMRRDFCAAADTLNELGKRCSEFDLNLCIRPCVGSRIENEEEIDRIMNEVDNREVFLCLDTGQLHQAEHDPVQILKIYGACVKHLHVSDIPIPDLPGYERDDEPEEKREFCPPGKGIIDFQGIADVLNSMDYKNWISLRFDLGNEEPGIEAKNAKQFLKKIL